MHAGCDAKKGRTSGTAGLIGRHRGLDRCHTGFSCTGNARLEGAAPYLRERRVGLLTVASAQRTHPGRRYSGGQPQRLAASNLAGLNRGPPKVKPQNRDGPNDPQVGERPGTRAVL